VALAAAHQDAAQADTIIYQHDVQYVTSVAAAQVKSTSKNGTSPRLPSGSGKWFQPRQAPSGFGYSRT
jgi:hypothetical protein